MVKKEFTKLYAKKEGIYDNEAQRRIDSILELMKEVLRKNETLIFRGFGSFEVRKTTRTEGVNPRTGKPIRFLPKKYVKFKTSKNLF